MNDYTYFVCPTDVWSPRLNQILAQTKEKYMSRSTRSIQKFWEKVVSWSQKIYSLGLTRTITLIMMVVSKTNLTILKMCQIAHASKR